MRDAHNKMSKRHGDPSYEDLIAQGYLTEAVVNYVALLGWAPGGEREFYTIRELAEAFDLTRISKSPAIFDIEKLTYFNAEYIKAMDPAAFAKIAEPWIRQAVKNPAIDTALIAALLQPRTEKLSDIPEKLDFFGALPAYDTGLFVHQKSKCDQAAALDMLQKMRPRLAALTDWTEDAVRDCLVGAAEEFGCKVVFAKKTQGKNLDGELYTTQITSFTKGRVFDVIVEKKFLGPEDRVLIIDDFLANGCALEGLIRIVRESGAELVGCGIAIEKGFQAGGAKIRSMGVHLESLAIIESMTPDGGIVFRD
jgi:glutamyl/glutaminyl-tRNA synthetase